MTAHTKGPWAWFANSRTGQVHLATERRGRVFVMSFSRCGFHGAQPAFQHHKEDCDGSCRGCGVMEPVFKAGYPEDHNGEIEIDHPDAILIAAAPDLLDALRELVAEADEPVGWEGHKHPHSVGFTMARAAIAKAEGNRE